MSQNTDTSEYRILGSCSSFACRCCRTKYGWPHQTWCEYCSLIEPTCGYCLYYSTKQNACLHPALKRRKDGLPLKEDPYPLRA